MVVYLRKELKRPTWYFRICIQGKRFNHPVPEATTQREAEKAEAIFKSELLRGKYDLADRKGEMLFRDLVKEYNDYAKTNKKSWQTEQCRVNQLEGYFGSKKLRDIIPMLIEKYRMERRHSAKLRQKKQKDGTQVQPPVLVCNASINREISILRKMFSIAVENGWIEKNPCIAVRVKPLREDSRRERFLEPQEEKSLLAQCKDDRAFLKPILICALHTGMRKGEILNLKWHNVDLDKGYITVTQTKSGRDRNIPISSTLKQHLRALHTSRSTDYVFVNPETEKPYCDLKRSFGDILEKSKIKGLRFHDLRHTAATRMVAAGIDLIVVQDILGHACISTTMRYSHPVPERKMQAVMALDSYVADNTKVVSINA